MVWIAAQVSVSIAQDCFIIFNKRAGCSLSAGSTVHKSKFFGYHFCSTCNPPMTSSHPDFDINIAQNNNCTFQKIHWVLFWCVQVKPWSFHSCKTLMSHGGEGFLAWVGFIQQADCGDGGRLRIERGSSPIRVATRSSSKPLRLRYVFYGFKASVTSFAFGCQILNICSAYSHSRPALLVLAHLVFPI